MSFRERKLLGLLAVLVAAMPLSFYLLLGGEWRWWRSDSPEDFVAEAAGAAYFSPLDGSRLKKKIDRTRQAVAVMIDNHPDARPEAGLREAKVVYEAPVEAPFTRYMAVFDSEQKIAKVGPVRSARSYFLDWVSEYGQPLYMHSGGSPEALERVKQRNISDADEFAYGGYYWRSPDRLAPHDLYTSSSLWQALILKLKIKKSLVPESGWKFAQVVGVPIKKNITKEVTLPYAADYSVTWKFDAKRQDYVRYINGEKQVDENGQEIRSANVLIQFVDYEVIDDKGRLFIMTMGNGPANILKKGQLIKGLWEKKSVAKRTRFFTADQKEIVLVPGKTWVQIVPKDVTLIITK